MTALQAAAVEDQVVDVGGIAMSALVTCAERPRAVILALHGGATTSRYFDCPGHPDLSLLRTAAALGFTVIALDRPGYGRSAPHAERLAPPARRVGLAYAAVDELLAGRPRGAGVFVLAHSIGCELAVRMACDPRGGDLLGLELSGTGRRHNPAAAAVIETRRRDDVRQARAPGLRDLLWEPGRLYPPDVMGGASIASPGPPYEYTVTKSWAPADFPDLAARVRVPVHFTLGDHERVWQSGPPALAEVGAMFTAAPRVVLHEQAGGGHNLSIGLTATAYHLKVLSFVEECVTGHEKVT